MPDIQHSTRTARFPFDPARWPFFYGWWMLGMCVLAALCSAPGQTSGVSAFVPHLLDATGLSRVQLSNAYLAGTLLSACFIPFGGRLLDRLGARTLLTCACILLALATTAMSHFDHVAAICARATGFPPVPVLLVCLSAGFALMRFSGQGLMTLCQQTTLGHWFDRRRGVAASIGGLVQSLVGNATPLLLNGLIVASGWRGAWRTLGLVVGLGTASLVLVFWRNTPESCGLWPDGHKPEASDTGSPTLQQRGWTRAEALRTAAFWTLMPSFAMMGLIITALTFHLEDIGAQAGLSAKAAFAMLVPFGITTMIVGPLAGMLADRIAPRSLLAFMVAMLAAHLLLMRSFGTGWHYVAPAIALGLAVGVVGPLSTATYPRFFGRLHLGSINGAHWAGMVVSSAIGPSLYALSQRVTGTYSGAMTVLLAPLAILFVAALRLKQPVPPQQTA